jgi:hypothetical protein
MYSVTLLAPSPESDLCEWPPSHFGAQKCVQGKCKMPVILADFRKKMEMADNFS